MNGVWGELLKKIYTNLPLPEVCQKHRLDPESNLTSWQVSCVIGADFKKDDILERGALPC
jgi:hypothetical protein